MSGRFVDLHVHTDFSDSTSSPSEVVARAIESGLSAIAICDHDTVDGIAPTVEVAKNFSLEIIPGIELTSELNGLEVHILGYFLDYKNKVLLDRLSEIRKTRVERIYQMCDKLKALGVNIEAKDVFDLAGKASVGRLHLARAMFKKGVVYSISDAFSRFIGDRGPAYVGRFHLKPEESISLIKEMRGLPVIAHPYILGSDDLILELIPQGLRGLEVYYPEHSVGVTEHFKQLAQEHGLLITGGSDCHGKAKQEIMMGKIKLPYEFLEKMKAQAGIK
ncbi:MAG: PHP domain-containing protein [Candidatus Omnitrophota bacterium]